MKIISILFNRQSSLLLLEIHCRPWPDRNTIFGSTHFALDIKCVLGIFLCFLGAY